MVFLIFSQVVYGSQELFEDPFYIPNIIDVQDTEICNSLRSQFSTLSRSKANNPKVQCSMNIEGNHFEQVQSIVETTGFLTLNEYESEKAKGVESILCVTEGYLLFKLNFNKPHSTTTIELKKPEKERHIGLDELCHSRTELDYVQYYISDDGEKKYIHPNYYDCSGWYPDNPKIGTACLKGEALQTFGQSGLIRNAITKMPSYPIGCVNQPRYKYAIQPEGCLMSDDDILYDSKMVEQIELKSDPVQIYKSMLYDSGFEGSVINGTERAETVQKMLSQTTITLDGQPTERSSTEQLFLRSKGANLLDFYIAINELIHDKKRSESHAVIQSTMEILKWVLGPDSPINQGATVITIEEMFMESLKLSNGNVFDALDRIHTALEVLSRTELYWTPMVQEFFSRLEPIRNDGFDVGGAWYHFFGAASGSYLFPKEIPFVGKACEDAKYCKTPPEIALMFKELNKTNSERSPYRPYHPDYEEALIGVEGIYFGRYLASMHPFERKKERKGKTLFKILWTIFAKKVHYKRERLRFDGNYKSRQEKIKSILKDEESSPILKEYVKIKSVIHRYNYSVEH